MRSGGWRGSRVAGGAGFILVEVAMAAVLVGLIVVPLGTALFGAAQQARNSRQPGSSEPEIGAGESSAGWEWGSQVVAASWGPGPVLHVRTAAAAGMSAAAAQVGLWVDGWLVGEELVPEGSAGAATPGELTIGLQTWTGLAGSELVIRVRAGDDVWGPPWRLAVASAAGLEPAGGLEAGSSTSGPTVVVHRSAAGTSSMTASWATGPLGAPPFPLLFALGPSLTGWGEGTLDGRSQWWWMEDGRSVDVYF